MDSDLVQLIESYEPNSQTIDAMSQVQLLATVGPSATGKSTIMKALASSHSDVHFVVGETSRAPRKDEQNGVDLIFRKKEEILEDLKAGRLTQAVVGPNGDLYCTRVKNFPVGKICVFPLVPKGVAQFRALPLKFFEAAFIVPDSFEHWQNWLHKQAEISSWSPEKMQGRLAEARVSYEFALQDHDIKFVLNDEIPKAAARLYQIAQGQLPNDEEAARRQAEINYRNLKGIIS